MEITSSETTPQHRAVSLALVQSMHGMPPEARQRVLAGVPVCTDDNLKEDFDFLLGSMGRFDLARDRLDAIGSHPNAFLRLLAGACTRPDDGSMAIALLDWLPAGSRIQTTVRMRHIIAHGFASSASPTAGLLDRLTDDDGPLDLIEHRHSNQSGLVSMVDAIARHSIKVNSDKSLPLIVANRRLVAHLFPSRSSFWALVRDAALNASDKSMGALARLQDEVMGSIPTHHMPPALREKEEVLCTNIAQQSVVDLAQAALEQDETGIRIRTLSEFLKMDIPMDPMDRGWGSLASPRALSALAPAQHLLGEDYLRLARPTLRNGSVDIVMDALVFGSDQWWGECLDRVSKSPEGITAEMETYVDFIEGEIGSRIAEDSPLDRAIDDLHGTDPGQAGALSARLIQRIPELTRITGSEIKRREWSAFMDDEMHSAQPLTAAMFRSIAIAMTTEPSSEPQRPAPRL